MLDIPWGWLTGGLFGGTALGVLAVGTVAAQRVMEALEEGEKRGYQQGFIDGVREAKRLLCGARYSEEAAQ